MSGQVGAGQRRGPRECGCAGIQRQAGAVAQPAGVPGERFQGEGWWTDEVHVIALRDDVQAAEVRVEVQLSQDGVKPEAE